LVWWKDELPINDTFELSTDKTSKQYFDFVIAFMGSVMLNMVWAVPVNNPTESSSVFPPSIWAAF
jgi:hypothetical protein